MTTILLLRHGENEWVKKGRLAGWISGVHLNEKGRKQAADAAQRLAHLPIKALFSSPVTRCMETAEFVGQALNLQIEELPALGEVRYGKWEGKKVKKLAKKRDWGRVQFFPSRFQFPDGENFTEIQSRAVAGLEGLCQRHPEQMIVVCSHADVIKLILAHYLGVHIDLFQRLVISPASVSVLQLPASGQMRLLRINDNGPITAPSKKRQLKKREEKSDGSPH